MTRLAGAFAEFTLDDRKFRKGVSRVTDSMKRVGEGMRKASRLARNMLLVGGGALLGFVKLAADQEKAEAQVRAALRATGAEVDSNARKLQDEAAAIQKVTRLGDESVLMLQALALNLGANADSATRMVKAAIGMAAALGQEVNPTFLRYIALAEQGEFTMLKRYIPALRKTNDALEQLAIFQEFTNRGFAQEIELAKTTSGSLTQLKNVVGDLGESIGQAFLPMIRRKISSLRALAPRLQEWITKNQAAIVANTMLAARVLAIVLVLPKLIALITGLVGLIASTTTRAIGLGVAISGIVAIPLLAWLRDIHQEIAQMKGDLDEAAEAWKAFGDARKRQSSDDTATGQLQAVNDQLAAMKKLINDSEGELVRAQGRLESLLKDFSLKNVGIVFNTFLGRGDNINKIMDDTKADIENLKLRLDQLKGLQEKLGGERGALTGPAEREGKASGLVADSLAILEKGAARAKKIEDEARAAQEADEKRRLQFLEKQGKLLLKAKQAMEELSSIGLSSQEIQLASLNDQQRSIIKALRDAGKLTTDLMGEIQDRFDKVRKDITDQPEQGEPRRRSRFIGIRQSIRNIQSQTFDVQTKEEPVVKAVMSVRELLHEALNVPLSEIRQAIENLPDELGSLPMRFA